MKRLYPRLTTALIVLATSVAVPVHAQTTVESIVDVQHDLFDGPRDGLRSNHTKGIVVTGEFTPAASATDISQAPHFAGDPTPVTVRFSNATGFPDIADHAPKARAKGMAVRFDLGGDEYTDLVLSSVPRFPVATPEKFLKMLTAVRDSANSEQSPTPIEKFLAANPAAKAFVDYPKPATPSFAALHYHGINAFRFINEDGEVSYGRYLVEPALDLDMLSDEEAASRSDDYLMTDMRERLDDGTVKLTLSLQIADDNATVDDATVIWDENRPVIELGTFTIEAIHPDIDDYERRVMFNPLALPEGIEPSDDPILMARPSAYALSYQHRAPEQEE